MRTTPTQLLALLAIGVAASMPTARAQTLIVSNGADACRPSFHSSKRYYSNYLPEISYSRFAITNTSASSVSNVFSNEWVTCTFPLVRDFLELDFFPGAPQGFDLQIVVASTHATPRPVTCTAETHGGDGPSTRFTTTRTVTVASGAAARLSFSTADLPADNAFTQLSMTCLLPPGTSLGRMFYRQPHFYR